MRQRILAQDQIGYGIRVERRRASRMSISHLSLYWSFGIAEGVLAAVFMLVPALIYHLAVRREPLPDQAVPIYLGYAALVGLVYGGFSAAAAAKLLDNGRHQQSIIAESTLG